MAGCVDARAAAATVQPYLLSAALSQSKVHLMPADPAQVRNRQWSSLLNVNDDHKLRIKLEMWANAQRDGRPAEHRWRSLFNAAVWLTPTTRLPCSIAAKTRNRLKLPGVPPN